MQKYLQKLEPRQLMLLMSGILLLIVAILITYFVMPQLKEYRGMVKTRDSLKLLVVNSDDLISQLQLGEKSVSELNKKTHGDMATLPVNQLESYIIDRLQQISWKHNIDLLSIKPSSGEAIGKFREILFSINLSGDYFNLYTWISELNTQLGFTVIKQFEMRPLGQHETSPVLSAKLIMATYRGMP